MKNEVSDKAYVRIGKGAYLVIIVMCILYAAVSLNTALNGTNQELSIVQICGAAFFAFTAITAVRDYGRKKNREELPLLSVLILIALALGSISGICLTTTRQFSLWSNAVIACAFVAVTVACLPQAWRNCAKLPQTSTQ